MKYFHEPLDRFVEVRAARTWAPPTREQIALDVLWITALFAGRPEDAEDAENRTVTDRRDGETTTAAAERRIRELADDAESNALGWGTQSRDSVVIVEVLCEEHLDHDYFRIKRDEQAGAFDTDTRSRS